MEQTAEHIEQFIALLRDTGTHVAESTNQVESDTTALDRLAEEVADQLGSFGHDLQAFLADLEGSAEAAHTELEGVASSAHAVADARCAAALEEIEHAEGGLAQAVQGAKSALDHDCSDLHDQGFQALATTLHEVDEEVEASRTDAEAAWSGLEGAVPAFTQELHTFMAEAERALDAAAEAIDQGDKQGIETEASECVAGFHALGPEVDSECTAVGDEMQQLYEGWGAEIESEGQELMDAVSSLFQGSADTVTSLGSEGVEEPAERVATEDIPPLVEELGEQVSMLTAGHEIAAELPPLASDLEVAEGVIQHVDELIKAMDH
ncbi:MAG TPA: hypothetical protein VKI41_03220 [Vicinamibacteria bacterium]|nr:hypothetical protein [Vicinamibacteria bacterium]